MDADATSEGRFELNSDELGWSRVPTVLFEKDGRRWSCFKHTDRDEKVWRYEEEGRRQPRQFPLSDFKDLTEFIRSYPPTDGE